MYSVSQKKIPPPLRFSEIFSQTVGNFYQFFLHTYYKIIYTLDYKFLFKYLHFDTVMPY